MKNDLTVDKNTLETVVISREEYETLKREIEAQAIKIAELEQTIRFLMENLRLTQQRQFCASSEKSTSDQLSFFNEAEATADDTVVEPELTVVEKHYRKKARVSTEKLPLDLPVEVVEHRLPEEEQVCPECGEPLHEMGRETRRELKLIPAQAIIVEHVRYTYACRNCEQQAESASIVKASIPEPVIKGSFASPEAVAHLATQKFVSGVPLYRQEQDFFRNGIELSRQTMSNWIIRCTEDWLAPLYNVLHEMLVGRQVLHADETTLQVLQEPGKPAQSDSYMWLYRTGGDAPMPIVLYEYRPDRKARNPAEFLKGFAGFLHTDGYAGYHALPDQIVIVGCWAHARRKWEEALKAIPSKEQIGSAALHGRHFCDRLFTIERDLAACAPQERYQKRQELARPVLDAFLAWLHAQNPAPKSAFGKAVQYTLDQWKYLENYLLDGRLEVSNNRAERSIKPFVIDRKNFLFMNTPRGATASAILFSIIETAKENGLNPFAYLTYIFRYAPNLDIPNHPEALTQLLPNSVPDSCKAGVRISG